jgi:chromosome segregation ATPase
MLILFPGATQPAPIMHLLTRLKDKDESRIWRQQFKAIGRALSRRVKLAEREAEVERLRTRLEQERTQRRDGSAQIKRLEQALQAESDALRQLRDDSRNALAEKEADLAAAQLALEKARTHRASQEDMVGASNQAAELKALAEQCDHLMAALTTAQTSVIEMEAQYARAQAEILGQNEALKKAAAERLNMLETYRIQRQSLVELSASQPT